MKTSNRFINILSFAGVMALTAYQFAAAQTSVTGPDLRVTRGKEIAPVTLNLNGKDINQVYLGSYLVNGVGGCNDCHSCPSYKGTNPFQVGGKALGLPKNPGPINTANYMAGGVPFGPFVSYNLTPDANGLPSGLTLLQFEEAIINGIDYHDGGILQVMPWPDYRHMDLSDIASIYAYLTSIPAAQPGSCTGSGQTGP